MRGWFYVLFVALCLDYNSALASDDKAPHQEGCLGKEIHQCADWFRHFVEVPAVVDTLDHQLERDSKPDVNGKRKSTRYASLFGFWHGNTRTPFGLDAKLDASNHIISAQVTLPASPEMARTEEEYAATGLYEAIAILVGESCLPSRTNVYRFFENKLKPTIRRDPRQLQVDGYHASETYHHQSGAIGFCGHKLSYSDDFGVDTSFIERGNVRGSFHATVISGR